MVDRVQWKAQQSHYMKRDHYKAGEGENLVIRDIREEKFKNHNGVHESKLVLDWMEERPALIVNATNLSWLISTYGGDDNNWARKKVYVWHDPTVKAYGNAGPGGLVLDAARDKPSRKPLPGVEDLKKQLAPKPVEEIDDDIPF